MCPSVTLCTLQLQAPLSLSLGLDSQPHSLIFQVTLFSLSYIIMFPSLPFSGFSFSVSAGLSLMVLSVIENTFSEHTLPTRNSKVFLHRLTAGGKRHMHSMVDDGIVSSAVGVEQDGKSCAEGL